MGVLFSVWTFFCFVSSFISIFHTNIEALVYFVWFNFSPFVSSHLLQLGSLDIRRDVEKTVNLSKYWPLSRSKEARQGGAKSGSSEKLQVSLLKFFLLEFFLPF